MVYLSLSIKIPYHESIEIKNKANEIINISKEQVSNVAKYTIKNIAYAAIKVADVAMIVVKGIFNFIKISGQFIINGLIEIGKITFRAVKKSLKSCSPQLPMQVMTQFQNWLRNLE